MTTQGKEIITNSDAVALQDLSPNAGYNFFHRTARRKRPRLGLSCGIWRREVTKVNLSVRELRNLGENYKDRWDGMRRQTLCEIFPQ